MPAAVPSRNSAPGYRHLRLAFRAGQSRFGSRSIKASLRRKRDRSALQICPPVLPDPSQGTRCAHLPRSAHLSRALLTRSQDTGFLLKGGRRYCRVRLASSVTGCVLVSLREGAGDEGDAPQVVAWQGRGRIGAARANAAWSPLRADRDVRRPQHNLLRHGLTSLRGD
jgi:hypothetical protein